MKKYYSLCVLENGSWGVEFGDYDKKVVIAEFQDWRERGFKVRELKIVVSDDRDGQRGVDVEVAKLNLGVM